MGIVVVPGPAGSVVWFSRGDDPKKFVRSKWTIVYRRLSSKPGKLQGVEGINLRGHLWSPNLSTVLTPHQTHDFGADDRISNRYIVTVYCGSWFICSDTLLHHPLPLPSPLQSIHELKEG